MVCYAVVCRAVGDHCHAQEYLKRKSSTKAAHLVHDPVGLNWTGGCLKFSGK